MESISPILIAAVVVLVVGGIGTVLYLKRERETYAGYEEIAGEVKKITRIVAGEVHRDGNDLVVTGEYKKGPTILRFSNAENTPGLHIEVRLPSTFHLAVSPKSAPENKFGHKVKLSLWLEQRFVSRSKDPEDIELLMTQRAAAGILERLCCSQKTMLELNLGRLHLLELVIPELLTQHVVDHLRDIEELTRVIEMMPGSNNVKISAIPRERSSWGFRAAMAAGVVIAAITVVAATRDHVKPVAAAAPVDDGTINGIVKADATLIPFVEKWHLAGSDDFDAGFANFLAESRLALNPRIEFDSDGSGRPDSVAYLLVNETGQKRLVLLAEHRRIFDSQFPSISGIARVPANALLRIHSNQAQSSQPTSVGQGIMLVRNADDPHSSVLLFVQNGTLNSGAPPDYRQVELALSSSTEDTAVGN